MPFTPQALNAGSGTPPESRQMFGFLRQYSMYRDHRWIAATAG